MSDPLEKIENSKQQALTTLLLEEGAQSNDSLKLVKNMLSGISPLYIARLLESTTPKVRRAIWELIPIERESEVLQYIRDDFVGVLVKEMQAGEVVELIRDMETDDIADILHSLPDEVTSAVLNAISDQDRARVKRVLDYSDDTAGGLMNPDMITVRPAMTIDVVYRYLRWRADLPSLDSLFVVNRKDMYLGLLPVNQLLAAPLTATVKELMDSEREAINAAVSADDVAEQFERNGWYTAPVVDDNNTLQGCITVDDIVDVVRGQAERPLLGRVGLTAAEEDTFAPVLQAVPRRALWLGINLVTAFIAAATISIFENTLDKVVALAILMPIVASMGGIAGSQILTIMERGIARGNINSGNTGWLLNRELVLAFSNGLLWATLVALVVVLWFDDSLIALLIAAALIINLLVGALAGVLLPGLMRAMNIDPAVAGSVVLTTLTDVVGFGTFLGMATLAFA